MMQSEYDFCNQYVGEFLTMLKYPIDNYSIELIEKYREDALFEIERRYKNTKYYNQLIQETNNDYDKQLFDFIKDNIALTDSDFFNSKISNMQNILIRNKDFALRLGMIVPANKIDDFYNNYLIALERTLRAEINPTLK